MKKYFMIVALLVACAINMNAQEAWGDLYIPDVEVETGTESVILQLCLKNNEAGAGGFEATLQLPEGFSVTKTARGSRLKERVDPEDEESDYIFTFASSNKEAGKYIQAYTTQKAVVPGTDGEVVKFTVSIPKTASGVYEIKLIDTEVANGSKVISTYTTATSKLTVGSTGIKEVGADGAAKGTYKYVGKDGNLVIKTANGNEFNAVGGRTK